MHRLGFAKNLRSSARVNSAPRDRSFIVYKSSLGYRILFPALVFVALVALNGCVAAVPVQDGIPAEADIAQNPSGERLADIADFTLPEAEPVIVPDISAVIITEGSRANIRSGPGLDSPIVAKANPGDEFKVTGRSDDNEWWQICCVRGPGDAEGEATETAWLASVVVEVDGNEEVIPVVAPVLPGDVDSTWAVDWTCGSDRCTVKSCTATVDAQVSEETSEQWMQIEHNVSWDDACSPLLDSAADSWVFEVDRYTGQERSGEYVDNFLYNYWLGEQPGPPTNVYTLEDGRQVAVYCSGPHELEIPETDGWTTVYTGESCHDVATGELVLLTYTKRWLFSGEYDGQQYERAYFGDYEQLEQRLIESNAGLYYVDEQALQP